MIGKRFWILSVLVAVVWGGGVYVDDATAGVVPISTCMEINTSDSYELTQNLVHNGTTPPDGCLVVNVNNVTIDLKGFTISGQNEDSGIFSGANQLVVRNGTVRRFDFGVNTGGSNGRVEGITAVTNEGDGIRAGNDSIVTNSIGSGNSGQGIVCVQCIVSNNVANFNNGDGFELGFSNIFNNTAVGNQGDGFQVDCPSILVGNFAFGNGLNLNSTNVSAPCKRSADNLF